MMKTALKFFMAAALLAAPASGVARDAYGNPDIFIDDLGLAFDYVDKEARTVKVAYSDYTQEEIIIPSQVEYDGVIYDVVEIGEGAFGECTNVKSVYIPEGVKKISMGAFYGCTSLTSVNIPGTVTYMGYAFQNCTGLTSVNIPEGVTRMDNAFRNCTSLTSVNIAEGKTDLTFAFVGCTSLTSMKIPEGVTELAGTFYSSGISSVELPKTLASIGCYTDFNNVWYEYAAFKYCPNLSFINLPTSRIGSSCFYGSGLKAISIEGSSSISRYAFGRCDLAFIVLSANFTGSFNDKAFSYNPDERVPEDYPLLPNTSTTELPTISVINYSETPSWVGLNAVNSKSRLFVPASAVADYKAVKGWRQKCYSIEPIESITPTEIQMEEERTLVMDEKTKLDLRLAIENPGENIPLAWHSSDPIVAPVDKDGVVTGWEPGEAVITVRTVNGLTAQCHVTVVEQATGVNDAVGQRTPSVKAGAGRLEVAGSGRMDVYTVGGVLVYSGSAQNLNVAPGVYIVRLGTKTVKVAVAR